MSEDIKTFFPDPIIIKIADREKREVVEFKIEEFVFENRIKFIKVISEIFSDIAKKNTDLSKLNKGEAVAIFIEVAGEKLSDVYELVLARPKEWIKKNITLKNEVAILSAIIEVNDIPFLVSQIKKAVKVTTQRTN